MQIHTFQFELDQQLNIKSFSPAFGKICEQLHEDMPLLSAFELVTPKIPVSKQFLTMFNGQLVTICPCDKKDFVFGGVFYQIPTGYYFIGYPQLTDMAQLEAMSLSLNDFVNHDPINFYIGTLQLKESLYRHVKELNSELKASAEHLESLVDQRTKELLQSEKMASVGTLAAGVAHEINNPIGFLLSNLSSLDEYMQSVVPLVTALSNLSEADKKHIEDLSQTNINWNDLAFMAEDISPLIQESVEGAQRVSKTVSGLRSFAHPSDSKQEQLSIQSAIDLAISLVRNELKYNAVLHYEPGDDFYVTGNLTELSQVFVNLLVNAVHAISENGAIEINIEATDKNVVVSVKDNGCGIPPENLGKLFQPFFTTKEIGTGTGLGLAISHGIIESHNGKISIESQVGEGTCFTITLPAARL
ncbi:MULTISPECIES: sensor histidine kinase [unclassified Alteromonas]|uniref:sensor histidine kinase n=1 Tax=unclassified Alteromonas TaxID=2614992 RepID=UPI0006904190|nr:MULTISPECIES: ATP-binding protein [unclassified Alteromonas]